MYLLIVFAFKVSQYQEYLGYVMNATHTHIHTPILLFLFGHGDHIINVTAKLPRDTPGALSTEVKGFFYNMKATAYRRIFNQSF